jgi:hypothetical protein
MTICFTINKIRHCYTIPVFVVPMTPHLPGPGPVNYPQLIEDAVLLASMQVFTSKASDAGVSKALRGGLDAAIKALQARAGENVTIQAEGE